MKKLIVGFIAGILLSATCFVPLLVWQANQENAIQVELGSDRVGSGTREVLRWRFSGAMVPEEEPVEFSPAVKGTFCWTQPDELTFQPNEGWRGCTTFMASLSEDLRGVDAKPLAEPRIFTFHSDPLSVRSISQSNYSSDNRIRLDISFSERVHPEQLKTHLKIRLPSGKIVAYQVNGYRSKTDFGITFQHPATNEVVVQIAKGLQPATGLAGLESNVVEKIKFSRRLKLLQLSTRTQSFGAGYIEARFNLPIDLETAKDLIQIEPEVEITLESRSHYYSQHRCRILGEFKPGTRYGVTFDSALKSTLGTTLENPVSKTLYFPDARPEAEFTARGSYMSPKGGMKIPFQTINTKRCKAVVRRVYPNNLVQLAARRTGRYNFYGTAHDNISHLVGELELPVDSLRNKITKGTLDLSAMLDGKTGTFHVELRPDKGRRSSHYVVVSDIGMSVKQSKNDLLVWVNSIRTLAPIPDAKVSVYSLENQVLLEGRSDADGIAQFDLADQKTEGTPFLVCIEKDADLSFLRLDSSAVSLAGSVGTRPYLDAAYEAYLFTDRGIYRPGETTHLKVVVRNPNADCPEAFPLTLKIFRPDGKVDQTLSALLNEYGTAEFEIPWPDYAATGKYRLEATVPGSENPIGQTVVAIEEFVPPQIRTRLEIQIDRVAAGAAFDFTLHAEHLFGGPAKNLSAGARVDFMPHPFKPPQWKGFAFGDPRRTFKTLQKPLGKKTLDATGAATFHVKTSASWRPAAGIKAIVSGTAMETGGRSVTAHGSRTIDVYPYYIGVQHPDESIRVSESCTFAIAVVQPDGTVASKVQQLKATIEKLSWASVLKREGDHYQYRSVRKATTMKEYDLPLENGRGNAAFKPICSGEYRLCIHDPNSTASSSLEFYVGTGRQSWGDRSMKSPDKVELQLDKKSYLVGESATLAIKAPFPGKLLLTMETDHILSHQILELTNNTAEVELPVGNECSPNAYCTVSIIRPALPEEVWGQHRASGRIALVVDSPKRKLDVQLELPKKIRPKTRLEIPLRVVDADGEGCKTEVVIAAVDEGICMLTAFEAPDPYAFFFAPRLPAITQHDLYAQLMPETLDKVGGTPSAPGGGMLAAIRKRLNPIKARRFKPVALWSTTVQTASNGTACVVFDVPEFTGELRIMAVAVDRSRYGSADQQLLVKRPLVVQSSLPRFLAPSDLFVLPVAIHNESKTNGQVKVSGSFADQVFEQSLFLAAGNSTNISFKLAAPAVPGKTLFHLRAKMGGEVFEERIEIAVRPPTSRVVQAGSGLLAAGKTETLNIPFEWMKGTGGGTIHLSAMPSVKLGGSLDYLLRYPYGCLEQTVSKAMPLLYLSELANQTQGGWVGKTATAGFVNAGIYRVLSIQKNNGSFGLWPNSSTYVWGSIYATHFLVEASREYDVPKERLNDALGYLKTQVNRMGNYNASYACHVLALAKKPQHGTVARLLAKRENLQRGAQVNLAAALVAAGKRRQALELLVRIGVNPSAPVPREIGGSLRSSIREDALLLSVFLDADPDHKWVPMLVQRLNSTRWRSTQENAVALMALGKYSAHFAGRQKPISGQVNATAFNGKESFKLKLKDGKVVLQNSGEGALHYFWKSEGVPAGGCAKEEDHGLVARRRLLKLDGSPADPLALRQGELYLVEICLNPAESLDNIVIEDLLPAGLEIENTALKTAQTAHGTQKKPSLSVLHSDIRDDRMLVFTGAFHTHRNYFRYTARAVTVGEFVWPALSAACMYGPAIQSVHGKGRIKVLKD